MKRAMLKIITHRKMIIGDFHVSDKNNKYKHMNKVAGLVMFLLFTYNISAQTNDGVAYVKQFYKEWKEKVDQNNENTIYLKYQTEIITKDDDKLISNKTTIEVISDKEHATFSTKEMSVFQDKKHTVSILPDKQLIIINEYAGDNYKKEKLTSFEIFQDSIFSSLITQKFEEVVIEGITYKKAILKANAYAVKTYKMASMEFLLDESLGVVKEVKVNYVNHPQFKSVKINILKQDLAYKNLVLKRKALANVFDSKGRLLEKYKSYKLIDNRLK